MKESFISFHQKEKVSALTPNDDTRYFMKHLNSTLCLSCHYYPTYCIAIFINVLLYHYIYYYIMLSCHLSDHIVTVFVNDDIKHHKIIFFILSFIIYYFAAMRFICIIFGCRHCILKDRTVIKLKLLLKDRQIDRQRERERERESHIFPTRENKPIKSFDTER